jgi:hypothetical protein
LRFVAQCLSPTRNPFDIELCQLLATDEPVLSGQELPLLLAELVREGVLVDNQGSYTFARTSEQEQFYAQLEETTKRRLHARLAAEVAKRAVADPMRTFEAGFHFLLAGEVKKARRFLNRNVEVSLGNLDLFTQ